MVSITRICSVAAAACIRPVFISERFSRANREGGLCKCRARPSPHQDTDRTDINREEKWKTSIVTETSDISWENLFRNKSKWNGKSVNPTANIHMYHNRIILTRLNSIFELSCELCLLLNEIGTYHGISFCTNLPTTQNKKNRMKFGEQRMLWPPQSEALPKPHTSLYSCICILQFIFLTFCCCRICHCSILSAFPVNSNWQTTLLYMAQQSSEWAQLVFPRCGLVLTTMPPPLLPNKHTHQAAGIQMPGSINQTRETTYACLLNLTAETVV